MKIAKEGYLLTKIINEIQKTRFKSEKTYRIFENP